jgi:hypothetical protein
MTNRNSGPLTIISGKNLAFLPMALILLILTPTTSIQILSIIMIKMD